MAAVLIHIKSKMLLRATRSRHRRAGNPRSELATVCLNTKSSSRRQMLLQKQQIEEAVLSNPALHEFIDAEAPSPK